MMGCWNHTCAVTNLPVLGEEEVVVVILKRSSTKYDESLCYPTFDYSPLPLTFQGKYNEYGGVNDCYGFAMPYLLDGIRNRLVEYDVGENTSHDISVKKEDFNVDFLFRADHENRLAVYSYGMENDARRLKHTVIRKEVYDGIMNNIQFESGWDKTTFQKIYSSYEDLKTMYPQYIADMREVAGAKEDTIGLFRLRLSYKIGDTAVAALLSDERGVRAKDVVDVVDLLVDLILGGADDYTLESIIDNAVQLQLLAYFYEEGRMTFMPPSGLGSQDSETDVHILRAKLILEGSNKINEHFSEENPYITSVVTQTERKYNPQYGDDSVCKCGHSYYRHFDSYEHNYPCGCKYCECFTFEEQEN